MTNFDPAALPAAAFEPISELGPLSRERIKTRLDARGYNYAIDSDGDIGGRWDDHIFYFLLLGKDSEYLQVRGRWSRTLPASSLGQLLVLANEWNAGRIWPKAYVRTEENETLGVYCEHSVDYEPGLTDAQLDQHLGCAISTSLAFFSSLDEQFPEAVAAAKEEIARLTAEQQ
ncbi:type III secretion system chaperone family protein [Cellulomonas edaphi]|uniref:YbjN domain-containing protein n=1 Tax=Cellulomonas edaphi TaxID=3053468 RepID=A0ABT7S939_9CELL|nr:YbjN domain-containing protein [Cellulomons edaphi]MDM7832059.1 YbjN domain-containing protein [Cellulomons edaphi]